MINIDKILASKRIEVSFAEIDVNSQYVKKFRKKYNLTQVALANIVGVKKNTVEQWEQGVNSVGGSSAVLLHLLNDNPELIEQLYQVKYDVVGNSDKDDYKQFDSRVIDLSTMISAKYCSEAVVC